MAKNHPQKERRKAKDSEVFLRFVFTKNIRNGVLRKGAIRVGPHPETGRLELSVFLLDSLSSDTFWEDMPRLGNRPTQKVKGYGHISALKVRTLENSNLDVEVNNDPFDGHADVTGWSKDPEEQMEQAIRLGKAFTGIKKPAADAPKTEEHKYLESKET